MHTWLIALTLAAACGSEPAGPKAAPTAESHVVVMQAVLPDAAPPDAPEPPSLTCDAGTTLQLAPAPEQTYFCARGNVRHGPFMTLFPDLTIWITGSYKDGKLDGTWQRHYPSGTLAEEGTYIKGLKDGHWRQLGPTGTVLGEYVMKLGTGTEKRWFDEGPLYSERGMYRGVANGKLEVHDPNGYLVVTAKYSGGRMFGEHDVGYKGTFRLEETFKNGARVGPRQIWQFTLLVMDEIYDDQGKLDGAFTIWRDKKIPRVQGTYEHGKRIGTWDWFDYKNNKEREGDYTDGKKTGAWFEWFDNKLVFSGSYTDGKPDGEFVYYDHSGNELGRFEIKDGTGFMETFWPNHQISSKTYLNQGVMSGLYQELTPRKKVVVEGHYWSDKKHGVWKEQTELGVPQLEQHWKRGRLDGAVKKYSDGKVVLDALFKDGKADGKYTELRDGKPSLTGQFTADKKQGTWTAYGADGQVVLTATYKDGILDGPWKQLLDGAVIEGTMVAGRRSGTWTRVDRSGATEKTTYKLP